MGTESKSKEWSPQKELAAMNKLVKIGEQLLQYAKSEKRRAVRQNDEESGWDES